MATLALFVALGGSSYAALRIGSKEVRNNSLRGEDVKNRSLTGRDVLNRSLSGLDVGSNSLTGRQIKETSLGAVPNALRVGGIAPQQLRIRCPSGTSARAGACIEAAPRMPAAYLSANAICGTAGRRLPTYMEMDEVNRTAGSSIAPQGEWTASVYRNPELGGGEANQLEVAVFVRNSQGVAYRQALAPAPLPFRCVALPTN
jgi:hypothetical protein